jgi:hypothetical protein
MGPFNPIHFGRYDNKRRIVYVFILFVFAAFVMQLSAYSV